MRNTWIWTTPDPVIYMDDSIKFDLNIKFPTHKKIKRLDSISVVLTTKDEKNKEFRLGGFTINNNDIINIKDTFENNITINIKYDVGMDTSSIFYHEEFFGYGGSLLSEKFEIAKIIKNER